MLTGIGSWIRSWSLNGGPNTWTTRQVAVAAGMDSCEKTNWSRLARKKSRLWDELCTRQTARLYRRIPCRVRHRAIGGRRRDCSPANASTGRGRGRDRLRRSCRADDHIPRTRRLTRRRSGCPCRQQQPRREQAPGFTRPARSPPRPILASSDSHCTRPGRGFRDPSAAMAVLSHRRRISRPWRPTWPRWNYPIRP